MNQLPHKFKLYRKGKFVGYEKHEKVFTGLIWIYHSRNECDWIPMPKPGHGYIDHDVKRQLTDLQDIHDKDIAFEDKLTMTPGSSRKYTVTFDNTQGVIATNQGDSFGCYSFNVMELVED